MLKWLKDHAVDIKRASKMGPEELHDKFIIGELLNVDEPEFAEEYQKMLNNLKVNYK